MYLLLPTTTTSIVASVLVRPSPIGQLCSIDIVITMYFFICNSEAEKFNFNVLKSIYLWWAN